MHSSLKPAAILLLGCFFCILAGTGIQAKEEFEVEVVKAPPTVRYQRFDLHNPPSNLPRLNPGEKGTTEAKFGLVINLDPRVVSSEKTDKGYEVVMTPQAVRVKLTLPIVIWVPHGATEKFLVHEEGHRLIAEYIYKDAEKLVKFYAETLESARFKGKGASYEEALAHAYRLAGEDLNNVYRRYVFDYYTCVGEEYDRLTNHGLNRFPEDVAIDQSLKNCQAYNSEFEEIRDYYHRKRTARMTDIESPELIRME